MLLAVLGVTIVRIGGLLSVHLFVGMLLVPPVLLKLASTGYRFVRYYTANPRYRRKGPPELALRVIAPMVVLSTVVVFASGVALLFAGPSSRDDAAADPQGQLLRVARVHGAARARPPARDAARAARRLRPLGAASRSDVTGRAGRMLALGGALVAGVVLAVLVIPEFGPWLHASGLFHHHHH